jgi:peroxiredoxin
LRDEYDEIKGAGVRLVVIGNGLPEQARAFREEEGIPFELWVDPEMKAYRAAGLRRGAANVFSLRSFGHILRAMRGGFKQSGVQGDPWQLGAVFLIDRDGRTLFEHFSREAGDHPPIQKIKQAVIQSQNNS